MNPKKRILILTPTTLPSVTGNAITVERWKQSLNKKDFLVEAMSTEGTSASNLLEQVERFQPDLIHVHHAFRAGTLLLHPPFTSEGNGTPLVVSPSGTDINMDLKDPKRRETVLRVFRMAHVIIAQGSETEQRLKEHLSELTDRIVNVPKAFSWLGNDRYDLRTVAGCGPGDILFFLPAGIRPVKGNLECLAAMGKVHALRPNVRVVFAGPALDTDYTARFEQEVRRLNTFAHWIPLIPPEAIRSAFETADVVLNTSSSEGLSNSLLEAIAAGRPVLVSDIPGNRLPVLGENGDPPAGTLFDPQDQDDFIRHAIKLIDDERIRNAFGQAGRLRASQWPTPETEADGLIAAY
ncbi:MAG: glycosyltransferase, partial [Pseudomonadota bacterium]